MENNSPNYHRKFIPIIIGTRPIRITRIANSGFNGGFDYHVSEIAHCFYSLFDFPIPKELCPILAKFGNRTELCDYDEWLPCGDEHILSYDRAITSKLCYLLNSYFDLTAPYYYFEFIPGQFTTEREDWHEHHPIKYIFSLPQ